MAKKEINNQKFKIVTANRIYDCDIKKLNNLTQFFIENKVPFNVVIENENELFNKAFKGAILYLLNSLFKGGDN